MAPINIPLPPELQQRLSALQELQQGIECDIARLYQLPGPLTAQQSLASVVRENVRSFARDIESIRNAADEQDREPVRRAILHSLTQYEEQLTMLQASSRAAILRSKQNADMQARLSREMLFAPLRPQGREDEELHEIRQRKGASTEETILRTSNNITESLRRTRALMGKEIEKSEVTTRVLADSSRTLTATRSTYTDLSNILRLSRQAIMKLEQSDWLDRILLGFGVLVFLSVVLYVVKRRTWDVGANWARWAAQTTGADRVSRAIVDKVTEVVVGAGRQVMKGEATAEFVAGVTLETLTVTEKMLDGLSRISAVEKVLETTGP